jgi:DNA-directed RNA polymerase specialized sigma24 family protein
MTPQTTAMRPDTVSLQRAQAGDREAFITLAEQHLPSLYRFVAREIRYHEALGNLQPSEVDVEDVLDEVFVTALRQLHRMPRHVQRLASAPGAPSDAADGAGKPAPAPI